MRGSRKRQNRISLERFLRNAILSAQNAAQSEVVKSVATVLLVAGLATASFYMGMWIERGRMVMPEPQVVSPAAEPQPILERSESTPKATTPKPAPVPTDPGETTPGTPETGSVTTGVAEPEATDTVAAEGVTIPAIAIPVAGESIFGYDWMYSPSFGDWRFHAGVDVKSDIGTPVKAALNGTVLSIKEDPTNGLVVVLDHGSGLVTVYGGLDGALVDEGDKVVKNQIIGRIGEPPLVEADLGPHLHFEVRKDGVPLDPTVYMPK